MPWRAALLNGNRVLARCNEAGDWIEEGGRVEVRYRPSDAKAYRAAARNLTPQQGDLLPDEHCVPGQPAPESGKTATKPGSPRGTKTASPPAKHEQVAPGDAQFVAYSDGACSGNPGPCGIGVVLIRGDARKELSEYLGTGTNNIAELTAILRTLEVIEATREPVVVHTDSQYAIGVLQKGWKAKANQELIASIKERMRAFSALRLVYVPGHAGVPLNERADELARAAVSSRATSGWKIVMGEWEGVSAR